MVEDAETLIYLVPPSRYISPTSLSLSLSMEGRIKSTSIVSAAGRSTAVGYMCCCKCACVHRNCCAVYRGLILVNNSVYCMYGNSSHFCCRQNSRYFLGTDTQFQLKRKRNQMVTVWSGNFFFPLLLQCGWIVGNLELSYAWSTFRYVLPLRYSAPVLRSSEE